MIINQGQVSVAGLAKTTGVSEVIIRQNPNTLEKLSYLQRAHGFAISLDSDDAKTRMMSNYTLKRKLAEFAASLIQPGETISIENGSNNALLARTLDEQKKNAAIITVNSYIARLLRDVPCEVILLGGAYQEGNESVAGPLTHQCIQRMHFSRAFIDTDGWQPETGFTGRDMVRIDVVNAVLKKEYETIILTDNSKFGAVHSYSISPVGRFNCVITDSKMRAGDLMHLEHSKLTIHVIDI